MPIEDTNEHDEEVKSVVLPPQAWAIGRTIDEARRAARKWRSPASAGRAYSGASPDGDARLREGDIVVIYGQPEALEHAGGHPARGLKARPIEVTRCLQEVCACKPAVLCATSPLQVKTRTAIRRR